MSISEDMRRVIRQRSERKTLYAKVYKNITIVSCEVNEKLAKMKLTLPIIPDWVSYDNFLSDYALSHIIDVLPDLFSMAVSKNNVVAIALNTNFTGKGKLGDTLCFELEHQFIERGEFGNIEIEGKINEEVIVKGNIVVKYLKLLWAREKI